MIRVDAGNDDGCIVEGAKRARGRDDRRGLAIHRFELFGGVAFDGGENHVNRLRVELGGVTHFHGGVIGVQRFVAPPADHARRVANRVDVGFARATRRGGERDDFKEGMAGQSGQKLLTGDAGRADYGDLELAHLR